MEAYYAGKIITEEGVFNDSYMLIDKGKIQGFVKEVKKGVSITKYPERIIIPGMIDIHTHGGIGYEPGYGDFQQLQNWSQFKLRHGVTGILPTTASIPLSRLQKVADDVKKALACSERTNILGIHMEGPFFSNSPKIGTQNTENILNYFDDEYKEFIYRNYKIIKYIAIDPVLPVSREIVTFCTKLGIKVAAGHSEMLYEEFLKEIDYGYSAITHTFNGMNGLHHRHPGLALAGCIDERLYSEIICDGFHVSYPMLKLFFNLKGYERAILVTDSMAATGMPPQKGYTINGVKVTVTDEGKVFKGDGGLAGSTLTLDKAVRNIVNNLNIPLETAVQMASLNPAKLLGIAETKGSLAAGKDADFVVLNKELSVIATYLQGVKVFDACL